MKHRLKSCALALRSLGVLRYAPLLRMNGVGPALRSFSVVGLLALIICNIHADEVAYAAKSIFHAHKAGSWYPEKTKDLNLLLNRLTVDAQDAFAMDTDSDAIRAVIVPHAGYMYSGKVAAAVYNLLADKKNVDRIIILGPSHEIPFAGIAVPNFIQYRTPLGTLVVDLNTITSLKRNRIVVSGDQYFKPEHSIELQLPFIQRAIPRAHIVPIVVGSLSDAQITDVAALLKDFITPKTLVIISSDFTHYGSNFNYVPFTDNVLLNIDQLDSAVLHPIQHQKRTGFEKVIGQTHDTVCGYNPICILLELIKQQAFGTVTTRLVAHDSSYTVTNDPRSIVTYASLIVTTELHNDKLNTQEQRELLTYARATLQESFKQTVAPALIKPIMTPLLEKPHGAFTTIWKLDKGLDRELRGCMGQVVTTKPLYEIVAEKILDSAYHDPRFQPVRQSELKNLQIQISVLQDPKPVKSYKDIVLHKHGIILTNEDRSALFLPTVPREFGFSLIQTLQELSVKAGLPRNAWKLPTTSFQIFESQDFEE
jgi:AmmeMemoRadiSam system protein B/AmmeMemoRadiSam system protein A